MREIKFRAWDKKSNYMIYDGDSNWNKNAYPVSVTNNGVVYCEKGKWGSDNQVIDDEGRVGYQNWEYDKYYKDVELMQYTGLKDSRGAKIYEGDIFDCIYKFDGCQHKQVVIWNEESASFILKGYRECDQPGVSKSMYDLERLEVVGNIYENPDLLPPSTQQGNYKLKGE